MSGHLQVSMDLMRTPIEDPSGMRLLDCAVSWMVHGVLGRGDFKFTWFLRESSGDSQYWSGHCRIF